MIELILNMKIKFAFWNKCVAKCKNELNLFKRIT